MRRSDILCLAFLVVGAPLAAQEMTDEELLSLFQQQRAAVEAAESGELGATRSLELIPVEDLVTEPELAPEGTTVTAVIPEPVAEPPEGTLPDSAAGEVAPARAGAEEAVIFADLPAELQVNVRINFPFDSASLTTDQFSKLDQLCSVMRVSDIGLFRIVGHTDTAGSDDYNERLSLLRAEEVRRYLVNTCGLEAERLEAVGMGEQFLADPNDPRGADNRRVEFQALS